MKQSEMDALPEPELNPVLNPLLAAHMGRWAEVYFTTLPEKRGQAVSQLLRELQSGSFSEPAPLQVINDETSEKEIEAEDAAPQVAGTVPISAARWSEPGPSLGCNFPEYAIAEPSPITACGGHDDLEAAWMLPGRGLPHLDAQSNVESKPAPSRYRIYVSVTLAILVAFLLIIIMIMAWRGTKTISRVAGMQSALSRVIAPAASVFPARPRTTGGTSSAANPPAAPVRRKSQATTTLRKSNSAPPSYPVVTARESFSFVPAVPSGAEEFATAQRYLNSTPRDSGAGAQWLWRAVGKRNVAAMTVLSDLYLRGDGVPKSCDQARLLLDAAARKGGMAAAERLRHLQAFGCQ